MGMMLRRRNRRTEPLPEVVVEQVKPETVETVSAPTQAKKPKAPARKKRAATKK